MCLKWCLMNELNIDILCNTNNSLLCYLFCGNGWCDLGIPRDRFLKLCYVQHVIKHVTCDRSVRYEQHEHICYNVRKMVSENVGVWTRNEQKIQNKNNKNKKKNNRMHLTWQRETMLSWRLIKSSSFNFDERETPSEKRFIHLFVSESVNKFDWAWTDQMNWDWICMPICAGHGRS